MSRVLITAGGSGIGPAMGTAFAAAGHQVCVTDVDAQALDACPDDWRKTCADAADEPAMAALFGRIATVWGGLERWSRTLGPVVEVDRMEKETLQNDPK